MVCPYKATTGLITAMMSMYYITSTMADDPHAAKKNNDDNNTDGELKLEETEAKKMSARRALTIALLVLFHVDLFTTGYLRLGVKQLMAIATTS